MELMKNVLTEKHQQFGYHSTTFDHLAKFLNDGKLYFSQIKDENDKNYGEDDIKNKIINKGFKYFLSTHNTHGNTIRNKPFLPVTLKINFDKFTNANDFFNGIETAEKNMKFIKRVDSVQYPFDDISKNQKEILKKIKDIYKNNNLIYIDDKYEYEDRMMTNHSNVDLNDGCIEECHILFNKDAILFTTGTTGNIIDTLNIITIIINHYGDYNINFNFYSSINTFNTLTQKSSYLPPYIITKGLIDTYYESFYKNERVIGELNNIVNYIIEKFKREDLVKQAIKDSKIQHQK